MTRETATAIRSIKELIKHHVPRSSINRALLTFPQLYGPLHYESQLTPAQLVILERIVGEDRPGNIIECGVYRAGTTVLLARLLKQKRRSSESMPSIPSRASPRKSTTRWAVARWSPTGARRSGPTRWTTCAASSRCWGSTTSSRSCLEQLWDRIVEGGWVVVEDYTNLGYPGAAIAADRFFRRVSCRSRAVSNNFLLVRR